MRDLPGLAMITRPLAAALMKKSDLVWFRVEATVLAYLLLPPLAFCARCCRTYSLAWSPAGHRDLDE